MMLGEHFWHSKGSQERPENGPRAYSARLETKLPALQKRVPSSDDLLDRHDNFGTLGYLDLGPGSRFLVSKSEGFVVGDRVWKIMSFLCPPSTPHVKDITSF